MVWVHSSTPRPFSNGEAAPINPKEHSQPLETHSSTAVLAMAASWSRNRLRGNGWAVLFMVPPE